MLKIKRFLLIAIMASVFSSLVAQTYSPYSRYGYGILGDQTTGISRSMGGIGYGIRNNKSANVKNPASYSAVDSLTFLFDIGVSANSAKLSDRTGSRSDYNGGLDYITLLFPVSRGIGVSAGILPFSTVGYDFGAEETNGATTLLRSYEGSGGISQVYLGLGYQLPMLKGLSVGANVSYLFGELKHTRSLSPVSSNLPGINSSVNSKDLAFSAFKFDLAAQYEMPLTKDNNLTVGLNFSPKINSSGSLREYRSETNTSDTTSVDAGIPMVLGVGASLTHKNSWLVGADVTYQNWKSIKYSSAMDGLNSDKRFNNRLRFNVGGEYVADPHARSFFQRVRMRAGANISNSYMNVEDANGQLKGYNEYGMTFGFGLPLYDRESFGARTSFINIGFEYKKMKPKVSGMVSENYYGISLGVNFNELWFYKRKVN